MVLALPVLGRAWHIINTDTGEQVDGDFEAVGVTRNVSTSYARHTSLNRQNSITQFLHGNADTLTFQARIFQSHALDLNVEEKLEKLIEWTKRDKILGRPPIVLFFVGDGSLVYGDFFSVIDAISDIVFDSPTVIGAVRGAVFAINLTQFTEFDLEKGTEGGNTRFHNTAKGEYMELIAVREYGDPLLGDVVRKLHPKFQLLQVGNVVGFPVLELVRGVAIVPRSVPFEGFTKRKDTAAKALRSETFERLNRDFVSHIIPEGL